VTLQKLCFKWVNSRNVFWDNNFNCYLECLW
jgi:hypothetical protein